MSWFMDQAINGILQLTIALIVQITNQLVLCLGFSPNALLLYFSGINTFSQAFKIIGLFLLIVIVLWQLMKNIFGPFSYSDKDNPVILLLRSGVAIALIFWSMSFMNYFYAVFTQPFYILNDDTNSYLAFNVTEDENSIFKDTISEAFDNFIETAQNTEEDYDSVVNRINDWIFPGVAILGALIELICIAILGFKFIFFLISILERYYLLMLQTFLSPLIWPTIVSNSTIDIFKKWFEILVTNFILIYLNMWLLGLIVKSMAFIFNPDTSFTDSTIEPNLILGTASFYVMIRIAQGLSNYVGKILNTFGTNTSLGSEIFMTLRLAKNSARTLFGGAAAVGAYALGEGNHQDQTAFFGGNEHYGENTNNYGNSHSDQSLDEKSSDNVSTDKSETLGNNEKHNSLKLEETNSNDSTLSENPLLRSSENLVDEKLLNSNLENLTDNKSISTNELDDISYPEENESSDLDYFDFVSDQGLNEFAISRELDPEFAAQSVSLNKDGSFSILGSNNQTNNKLLGTLLPSEKYNEDLFENPSYTELISSNGDRFYLFPDDTYNPKTISNSEEFLESHPTFSETETVNAKTEETDKVGGVNASLFNDYDTPKYYSSELPELESHNSGLIESKADESDSIPINLENFNNNLDHYSHYESLLSSPRDLERNSSLRQDQNHLDLENNQSKLNLNDNLNEFYSTHFTENNKLSNRNKKSKTFQISTIKTENNKSNDLKQLTSPTKGKKIKGKKDLD